MTTKQKKLLFEDALFLVEQKENDFPVVSDLCELPNNYRGFALHINDHGNIALYNCFKNGNVREIASRV